MHIYQQINFLNFEIIWNLFINPNQNLGRASKIRPYNQMLSMKKKIRFNILILSPLSKTQITPIN